jgi:hypothetical protein
MPTPNPVPLNPLPEGTTDISRTGSSAVVYHVPHSPSSSTTPLHTTILLPKHSQWTSGLHWHNTHTEYLRLVKGSISVRLGTQTILISAALGGSFSLKGPGLVEEGLTVQVDRGMRHEWGRAQDYLEGKGAGIQEDRLPPDFDEDVVVEEWTDPSDIGKPLFFFNLNGIIAPKSLPNDFRHANPSDGHVVKRIFQWLMEPWWIDIQLWIVFWELDNYPVLLEMVPPRLQERWRTVKALEHVLERVMTYVVLFAAVLLGKLVGLVAVSKDRTPKELWDAWRREPGSRVKVE